MKKISMLKMAMTPLPCSVDSGQPTGLFSVLDACRGFGEYIREHFPRPTGDDMA